jgi:hypothetical protein
MLIISAVCLAVSWLLGMRSIANDEVGDFLDRYDTWIMVGVYSFSAVMMICLGVIASLALTR